MIEIRPFDTLGNADHGWLKARHHFSFARYVDPERMSHGSLRVWNDDEIAPNSGFPSHGHTAMEIITYVRRGAITHEDNLGNKGRTEAGDVQVMSAGSGIRHSEYNRDDEPATLFQIWIEPDARDGEPISGQRPFWGHKPFPREGRAGAFVPLASGFEGDAEALPIRANARVLGATLKAGAVTEYRLGTRRHAYLVSAEGSIEVNGIHVKPRDGVAIANETVLVVKALEDAEIVLVDAP